MAEAVERRHHEVVGENGVLAAYLCWTPAVWAIPNEAHRSVDDHPPSARVHLSGGAWLTLRAARISGEVVADEHDIAVTIEATSPVERTAVARAFVLSARETGLLACLFTL